MAVLQQDLSQIKDDFYDGLYLHSLLQSHASRRIKSGEHQLPRSSAASERGEWQRFLDDLALLCDSRSGGSTTTAIAVEQQLNKVVFWVTSNEPLDVSTAPHLSGLVKILQYGIHHCGTDGQNIKRIFGRCVQRSPQRVGNYVGRLSSAVEPLVTDSCSSKKGTYWQTSYCSVQR